MNAHDVDMTPKSSRYTVSYDGHDYTVAMNTTGLFNVYNTLAAIGACLLEGISMEDIDKALKHLALCLAVLSSLKKVNHLLWL